ncbi:MAG: sigma-54-dependent transcriptional regulator [Candidatus Polarisedimenticolia bacterium]
MSAAPLRLLVIHEEPSVRRQVADAILPLGEVFTAADLASARAAVPLDMVDVALLDPRLASPQNGLPPALPLIALGPVPDAVAGDAGAAPGPFHAELTLPPDPRACAMLARSALDRRKLELEVRRLRADAAVRGEVSALTGHGPAMEGVRRAIRAIADSGAPVLVRGETGTGRAQAGRAIHAAGPRRDGPFVTLLLSAFSPFALETELCGRDRARGGGRVESAHRGTLLLRDLEALPGSLQEPLLRLARSGVWAPPEGRTVMVDIRLVATVGPGLDEAVSSGRFREDLLQSLEAVTLHMPPLRERREDIPVLAAHFLESLRRPGEASARRFSQDALEVLSAQAWRGNVRELRHVVESVALHSDAVILSRRDLPRAFTKQTPEGSPPVKLPDGGLVIEHEIAEYEKAMLALALERAAGRRSEAAALLGLNRDQMKYLCRKHGL